MEIIQLIVGQLQTNCYLVIKDNNCLIIDPGDEGEFVLEEIQRRRLTPLALLATHGHFDHIMAVGEIQVAIEIVPFFIHKNDLFLVKKAKQSADYFLNYRSVIIDPREIKFLKQEKKIIGDFKFKVLLTPGHTPGGCSFLFKKEKIIFTGDTLFKGNIGRYDFSYSRYDDLKKSVKRLLKLNKETIIYPGHGEQSLIREERKYFSSF